MTKREVSGLLICEITVLVFIAVFSLNTAVFAQQPLSIDEAVSISLKENPELAAARLHIEGANARLVQAGLLPNPEIEIEGKFDTAFRSESRHTFSVGIVQPFSISSKIQAQKDAARIEIRRAFVEVADLERRIAGDIRRTFTELLAINEQIKLQESQTGLNEELLRAIRASLSRGLVSEKDVNTAQIALNQSRQRQKELESRRVGKHIEMNRLMGRPAGYGFTAKGSLEPLQLKDLSDYVLEKALERRPEYIAALIDAELARSEQRLTKAEQTDLWRIGIGYEREQKDGDAEHFIGMKLSVPIPLFDKKQGRILETTVKESRALKTAEALKLRISLETEDALNRVRALLSMINPYPADILNHAETNVRLSEIGYSKGLIGITEVIRSRQQLAELKSRYIEMLKEYNLALTDLESAAGISFSAAGLKLSNEVISGEK